MNRRLEVVEPPNPALPDLPVEGDGAPPRANGELVFDAPWQSRAFGVAAALAESGRLSWPDFQRALIDQVGGADAAGYDTGLPAVYWNCWLEALGVLVVEADLVSPAAWSDKNDALARRPAGHDHL